MKSLLEHQNEQVEARDKYLARKMKGEPMEIINQYVLPASKEGYATNKQSVIAEAEEEVVFTPEKDDSFVSREASV